MNLLEAELKLRELHRDGERTRLSFDISSMGTFSYTVQRIVDGRVHRGCSLVDTADAMIEANDSLAAADMHLAIEEKLTRD